jgi:hypothetical protein
VGSNQQSSLMAMLNTLRQESYSLKLDQNSKLDAISTTLAELTSTTENLRDEISTSQSIMEPSRFKLSPGANQYIFKGNQSALLTSSRVDALSAEVSRLALTKRELEDVVKEQAILKSLNFPSRPVRHDNISRSHKKTFQWIINPDEDSEEGAGKQFRDWLRFGEEIFWFSGKAGSGKSAMMKFLADHEATREMLEEWANESKLVIASHYFWSAGTPMQKSHEGLYRTLLYDIFRLCPVLIHQVCPVRWAQADSSRTENDWTLTEMLRTLQAISEHLNLPGQYCFFIDGLDEYDGDHLKLCEILRGLSRSSKIKFCLASRPWNAFVDAFGKDPDRKMCIEDLTRRDIQQYTKSRLMEHEKWNTCQFRADQKQCIIDDITDKARGVFLWVFLVTRSLREGLTNGDTILDLRNRLESLPTDLERFFKHMLEVVDPVYHEKMASFLTIAVNANTPLQSLIYSMHEHEYEDEDYAINLQASPLEEYELVALQDECRRRVNARCGDLLEVKHGSVEWLHRTVRDFLFTREMNDYLQSKVRRGFSANLSTFKAYVAVLKRTRPLSETVFTDDIKPGLLWKCLQFATEALEDSEDSAFELLETLESMYMSLDEVRVHGWGFEFRREILRAGVDKYVSNKLRESPRYFDSLSTPPLSVVLEQSQWTTRHLHIIRNLLESGQDPNTNYSSTISNWTYFLERTCGEGCENSFQNAMESGLFALFLQSGARRDVVIGGGPAMHCEEVSSTGLLDGYEPKAVTTEQIYRTIRQWNISKTPCSRFVQALFSQTGIPKNPDRFLTVLDDFSDSSFSEELYSSVLSTLEQEVSKIEPKVTRLGKLKFAAQITEKIVRNGVSFGCRVNFLEPVISKAFPGALGLRILHILTTGNPPEIGQTPLKRKAEDDLSERINKRPHKVPAKG